MSIPVSIGAAEPRGADKLKQEAPAAEPAPAAQARLALNTAIVQSSLSVSISAGSAPLALVLRSALTGINEALKAQYGEHAVEHAMSEDNTPQGTAGRIVALSTAFFGAFKQQHPGQDEALLLDQFMSTIRDGVDSGFREARDILQGLNVLNGEVAANIDQTYALVQQGYVDFEAAQRAAIGAA